MHFLIGFAITFLILDVIEWPLQEGGRIKKSLRFSLGAYYLHIHHWFIGTVILVIFLLLKVQEPLIFGILAGMIFQGLQYRDRFVFLYEKKKYEEIYSKFK